jgi:hypothetical protein
MVSGEISAEGIAGPLFLTGPVSNVGWSVSAAASSVSAWSEAYTQATLAYIKTLNHELAGFDHAFAQAESVEKKCKLILEFDGRVVGPQAPQVKHPPKLSGFLAPLKLRSDSSMGSDFVVPKLPVLTQLPALKREELPAVADAMSKLMEVAMVLRDQEEIIGEASWNLHELEADMEDDFEDEKADQAFWRIQEVFYAKSFRKEFAWPLTDLAEKLEKASEALGHWLDRSVKKES